MCEPASHASHNASHASHASQGVSHASHASQGASHASHNMKNEKLKKKKKNSCVTYVVLRNLYGTDVIWTLIMPMARVPFCSQHASPTVSSKFVPRSINNIQDLENW